MLDAATPTSTPAPTQTPTPIFLVLVVDFSFSIRMINSTISGGRVFNAPLNTGSKCTLSSGERDGTSNMIGLGAGTYRVYPDLGVLRLVGAAAPSLPPQF
jgi:hypothetical protein